MQRFCLRPMRRIQPFTIGKNLEKRLQQNAQIKGISPFVSFTALVENGSKLKVVQVKGIEKQEEDRVSSLGNFVQEQGWDKLVKKVD